MLYDLDLWFMMDATKEVVVLLIVQEGGVFKPASAKRVKVLSQGAWECAENTQLLLWLLKESFGEGNMRRLKKMEFVTGNTGKFWELLVDGNR